MVTKMAKKMASKTASGMKNAARNWKTSLSGIAASAALFVATNPGDFMGVLPPLAITAAKFIMVTGILGMGLSATDGNKSGTAATVTMDATGVGPAVK